MNHVWESASGKLKSYQQSLSQPLEGFGVAGGRGDKQAQIS
jgi:hypothetical protein